MDHLRSAWATRIAGGRQTPGILYHYTSGWHLPMIAEALVINTTDSNIDYSGAGPPVVWLSSSKNPEQKWQAGGLKSQVRITVGMGVKAYWWPEWAFEQGIQGGWYTALSLSGGDPEEWWVSPKPIPVTQWLKIEDNETGEVLWDTTKHRMRDVQKLAKEGSTRSSIVQALAGLDLPECAVDGDCLTYPGAVITALKKAGYSPHIATVWGWVEPQVAGFVHQAVEVDGMVVDPTATQYDASLPSLIVLPVSEYTALMAKATGVASVTIS